MLEILSRDKLCSLFRKFVTCGHKTFYNIWPRKFYRGIFPLHLAVINGKPSLVETLLESRANVDAKSETGVTALHLAAAMGHSEIIRKLIDQKAKVNQVSISPIFYEQIFHTKVFCAAFMCSQFGFVIFW